MQICNCSEQMVLWIELKTEKNVNSFILFLSIRYWYKNKLLLHFFFYYLLSLYCNITCHWERIEQWWKWVCDLKCNWCSGKTEERVYFNACNVSVKLKMLYCSCLMVIVAFSNSYFMFTVILSNYLCPWPIIAHRCTCVKQNTNELMVTFINILPPPWFTAWSNLMHLMFVICICGTQMSHYNVMWNTSDANNQLLLMYRHWGCILRNIPLLQ
jgi:hypothetical protein